MAPSISCLVKKAPSMPEPDNLVLQLLREMRGKMDSMATKDDFGRLDEKIDNLGADLRSDMHIHSRLG